MITFLLFDNYRFTNHLGRLAKESNELMCTTLRDEINSLPPDRQVKIQVMAELEQKRSILLANY
jgi:hypothetical protein